MEIDPAYVSNAQRRLSAIEASNAEGIIKNADESIQVAIEIASDPNFRK